MKTNDWPLPNILPGYKTVVMSRKRFISDVPMPFVWLSDVDLLKAAKKHICTGAYQQIMCRLIVNHDRRANILDIDMGHRRRPPSFESIHANCVRWSNDAFCLPYTLVN